MSPFMPPPNQNPKKHTLKDHEVMEFVDMMISDDPFGLAQTDDWANAILIGG